MIKKFLFSLIITSSVFLNVAFAEEINASVSASVIQSLQTAQPFVTDKVSDPSAAMVHLKGARTAAEKLQGNAPEVKKAVDMLNQAMIAVKSGDTKKASPALEEAIKAFEAVK